MPSAHHAAHVAHRIGGDQRLGQRRRLDQEEPVPVGAGERIGGVLVHRERGRDVEQQHAIDRIRMVRSQTVGHARAAVVRQHAEALEAVVPHRGQRIERHSPLAVGDVRRVGRGAARIAVAAQVDRDHGEALGERWRHAVPDRMRLPDGRAAAAGARPARRCGHARARHRA
ncbi:hypothetical protein M2165_005005 [Variovorax sp. TBS-050B]|nr:hypothetical protein [Variovorax sp. TBS-050B]